MHRRPRAPSPDADRHGITIRRAGARVRARTHACAGALLLLACTARGAAPAVSPARAPAVAAPPAGPVAERDVRRLLAALADDSMEGRMTGSRGSARAATLIARELQRAGVDPAGDHGYFQRVPIAVVPTRRGMRPRLYPSFAALDTVPPGRRRTAVNVLGILRGRDPVLRDTAVVIDAHYDHLGIGPAVHGDSIYNGADDDASGTVAVIEIARALARGTRPRRTVVFAAMTGEEVGLLGTRWYLQHPVIPLARMAGNLEIEMIGRPDPLAGGPGRAWLTGFDRSTFGAELRAAGVPIGPDPRPRQHFFRRSDNIAFARAGIPAHTLSTFALHADYHQPSDEISRIDVDHMTRVIDAAVAAARLLASGPAPRWKPGGRP